MRTWIAVAGATCGVLLIGYALMSEESPEEQINAKLDRLEASLALDSQTTNPLMLKARFNEAFEEIFTEQVAYRIPELTSASEGRGSLSTLASGSTRYFNTLDVDLKDRAIELGGGGAVATVSSTAVLTATRGGAPERDERRVRFEFEKADDGWQIAEVRVAARDEGGDEATGDEPEE